MLTAFIDTNILLDLLLSRSPFNKDAETLFWLSEKKKIHLQVSAISIINAAYVARRNQFDYKDIRKALIAVLDFVHSEIPTVTPIEFLIAHQDLL